MTSTISQEVWTRLQVHAHRVRGLCHYPGHAVDPSVWIVLLSQCHGAPLLPKLRVLDVDQLPLSELPLLFLLLGHSSLLRELYLSINDEQNATRVALLSLSAMLFETISTIAPDLNILYLDNHFPASSRSLQSLSRLTRLRELKLCDPEATVSSAALRAISSLKDLRVLFIEDINLGDSVGELRLEDGLHSLETLYMHVHPADLLRLVRAAQFASLKHFDVMLHCPDGVDPVGPLSSIAPHLPQTVHNLRLGFCDGPSTVPPSAPLAAVLEPMRPLKDLSQITIDSGAQKLSVGDSDLALLADLWPRMLNFTVADDKDKPRALSGSEPQPTFAALVDLARRCPELMWLALPCLDTSTLPPKGEIPVLNHGLRNLVFEWVVGETAPVDVAEAIHRIFPELDVESKPPPLGGAAASVPEERAGTKRWDPIREQLKALRRLE